MSPRAKQSAGILLFRRSALGLEVFLVHPGGPFFVRKDEGAWSLPKGEIEGEEAPLDVAFREFEEETGRPLAACRKPGFGEPFPLGSIVQRNRKTVHAWAIEGDWPEGLPVDSNTFEMEWPRGSGRQRAFPEVDDGRFFDVETAGRKLNPAQVELVKRLIRRTKS